MTPAGTSNELDVQNKWEENTKINVVSVQDNGGFLPDIIYDTVDPTIIINDTLARSLEPVVTECKEHTIHTQTQIVASRKPKEIKHTHEGEANFT